MIDPSTFEQVQDLLRSRANRSVTPQSRDGLHLLSGLLYDETGDQLSPTHATKAGKRYRYYVSRRLMSKTCSDPVDGWRIPSRQIEELVCQQLIRFLRSAGCR